MVMGGVADGKHCDREILTAVASYRGVKTAMSAAADDVAEGYIG